MTADLQAIRNATDPWVFYGSVVKLRRLPGNVAIGRCPFHGPEKTPSLHVKLSGHKHSGRFKCFGCDAHGDLFDFLQRIDGVDLPTAIRSLAADAGITVYEKPETPAQRREREHAKLEREMCQWYFRQEWQKARRGLNRAMAAIDSPFGEDYAEIYGRRLRWIERERGTAAGLDEFRAARVPESRYREWLSGDLRRYAARMCFSGLVLEKTSLV